jgi:hypothetical protein
VEFTLHKTTASTEQNMKRHQQEKQEGKPQSTGKLSSSGPTTASSLQEKQTGWNLHFIKQQQVQSMKRY